MRRPSANTPEKLFRLKVFSGDLLPFRLMEDGSGCAYDKESLAIIKLNNTTVLYLKEVTKFLALVCILREESFERKGEFSPEAPPDAKPIRPI